MLRAYIPELERLVDWVTKLLQVDVAIFDKRGGLLTCSDPYRKLKGSTVHAPSIQEVIDEGKVMVQRPGHMASCRGCRFRGNCPAKIEILRAVVLGKEAIGVISFTSFTAEGHEKITSSLSMYKNALRAVTEWLVSVIRAREQSQALGVTQQLLQGGVELSETPLLVVDSGGHVTSCSRSAMELFSFCNLYACTLAHLLPEPVVEEIFAGKPVQKMKLQTDRYRLVVSSVSSMVEGCFQGAVLSLFPLDSEQKAAGEISTVTQPSLADFKGKSSAVAAIRRQCIKVADSPSTVLIQGETGTGKSMLARVIHACSARSTRPFVVVNCSSIPESLFESELFGYEEGAFTGARKGGKPGKFEQADGGTLFFDEIAEMPLPMQAKLLSVLQESIIERVGGTVQIPVNIRYIAATNKNLQQQVEKNRFRSDLFYRLNVIPLQIPPLRERMEDIGELIPEFLQSCSRRLGTEVPALSAEFLRLLSQHVWPGNARELQNIIEYCVNMAESDVLTPESLPLHFWNSLPLPGDAGAAGSGEVPGQLSPGEAELWALMQRHGWSVGGKKAAAGELGISLRTLYRRLAKIRVS